MVKDMRYFVTGGAGFIGSNCAIHLLNNSGNYVTIYDNFSTGKREFLNEIMDNERLTVVEGDLLDFEKLLKTIEGHDFVFHFAANADVRSGISKTDVDFKQGVQATFNLLEAMRINGIKKLTFTSSSTIYGEAKVLPTPENYGPLIPISLYGAAKLGAEAFIMAFAASFEFQVWIFRLANVIGNNGTHGVIVDFIEKLQKNPNELEILGNGRQEKSYLLVDECVKAINFVVQNSKEKVNIVNLGSSDKITVVRIAEIIVEEMKLPGVKFTFTGGSRGWTGDVALMILNTDKIKKMGFEFKLSSEAAVREAVRCVLKMKKLI